MDDYGDSDDLKKLFEKSNPELKQGNAYIIKRTMYDPFYIKVLRVTEKCYKLQYENENTIWVEKEYYNSTYTFVEELSN